MTRGISIVLPYCFSIALSSCGSDQIEVAKRRSHSGDGAFEKRSGEDQVSRTDQAPSIDPKSDQPIPDNHSDDKDPNTTSGDSQEPLRLAMEYWYSFAPRCEGYPAKELCDDGDSTLFNGLLCFSGISLGCEAVAQAQDAEGRWWRSPRRVVDNLGESNSFSRDMALGVVFYLLATKDIERAELWLQWIEHHRPCVITNLDGRCALPGLHRLCTDDDDQRCTITPNLWATLDRLWAYIGLEPTSLMKQYRDIDRDLLENGAETIEAGYQLHLHSLQLWVRKVTGHFGDEAEKAVRIIAEREEKNPFFRYLNGDVDQEVTELLLELCPKPGHPPVKMHQWAWERAVDGKAWEESMGWDCLFVGMITAAPDFGTGPIQSGFEAANKLQNSD